MRATALAVVLTAPGARLVTCLSGVAVAAAACADPPADNFRDSDDPGSVVGRNAGCVYSCAGLARYFEVGSVGPCFIAGQNWPTASFNVSDGATAIVQGRHAAAGAGGTALAFRVRPSSATNRFGLVVRQVEMKGLASAANGGAIYVHLCDRCSLTVEHSLFSGCRATDGCGGAIAVAKGGAATAVTIRGCRFAGNSAASWGGAVGVWQSLDDILVVDTVFVDNTAGTGQGGAMAVIEDADMDRRPVRWVLAGCSGARNYAGADGSSLFYRNQRQSQIDKSYETTFTDGAWHCASLTWLQFCVSYCTDVVASGRDHRRQYCMLVCAFLLWHRAAAAGHGHGRCGR